MNKEDAAPKDILGLIEVQTSEDGMLGYIKLTKDPEKPNPFTKEHFMEALREKNILFGINEESVFNLAQRPIYNLKINVVKGQKPIDGENGKVHYLVKRDAEYHPDYEENGVVDYKNLNYFQMVKMDQVLCEITKERPGIDGQNIYGQCVTANKGKKPVFTVGENCVLSDDATTITSVCDGIVRFINDTVTIKKVLHISRNVDIFTGNINFSGDVTINGDVSMGFSVKSGGNITIKGVVEDAHIEAAGNLYIASGINGGCREKITVGKDLRCKYIESAILDVKGSITADYIVNSKIICMGNIKLTGTKELICGGEITLAGDLTAKEIGNERERPTKIKILEIESEDTLIIEALIKKTEEVRAQLKAVADKKAELEKWILSQARGGFSKGHDDGNTEKIAFIKNEINKEIIHLKNEINANKAEIERKENERIPNYAGLVSFRKKLYQGVIISFGDNVFQFELDNLEHSKIYWDNEIVLGLL